MTASPEFTPAKRGDFAILEKWKRGYSLIAGNFQTFTVTVGIVTSVDKQGAVKRVAPLSATSAEMTRRDWNACTLLPPSKLRDPEGFKAECASRQDTSPETWRPFESLEDVRQTALKFR